MLQITISAAKKVPHPAHQFGSISAQVSLVGEASSLADAPAIMRDLFAAAQAGCDQHLADQSGVTPSPSPLPAQQPRQQPTNPGRSSAPYRSTTTAPRRGIPPISDAQRRLLDRLLDGDHQRAEAVCSRAGVSTIGALNMKQASECIDWLKVPA